MGGQDAVHLLHHLHRRDPVSLVEQALGREDSGPRPQPGGEVGFEELLQIAHVAPALGVSREHELGATLEELFTPRPDFGDECLHVADGDESREGVVERPFRHVRLRDVQVLRGVLRVDAEVGARTSAQERVAARRRQAEEKEESRAADHRARAGLTLVSHDRGRDSRW